jgi:hypothetical protein
LKIWFRNTDKILEVEMIKSVLLLLLFVVTTSSAARESVWTWDVEVPPKKDEAPQKRDEVVYPDAVSGWVEVASKQTFILFINLASIRKAGDNVTMSHLYELQIIEEVAGKLFKSVQAEVEYNCIIEQTRTLSASAYAESMAKGELQDSLIKNDAKKYIKLKAGVRTMVNRISDPGKWKPITPGSTEEILWKYACGK